MDKKDTLMAKIICPMDNIKKEHLRLLTLIQRAEENIPNDVDGKSKFIRLCKAESHFVDQLNPTDRDIVNRISSTNTCHLEALLDTALTVYKSSLLSLLHKFKYHDLRTGQQATITVDIVCRGEALDGGGVWAKVVARNPLALHNIWRGNSESRATPLTEHAKQFLLCVRQHPSQFTQPSVRFHVVRGITEPLYRRLCDLGVHVIHPEILAVEEEDESEDDCDDVEADCFSLRPFSRKTERTENSTSGPLSAQSSTESGVIPLNVINLDVTSLMVLVSELCHTGPPPQGVVYRDPSHRQMAVEERSQSAHALLRSKMEGSRVIVCDTAWKEFENIVKTVGGPEEQKRAQDLIHRKDVEMVPDCMSERARRLKTSAKVREKNKIVFGTGDHLRAVTLTANTGFVRAAANQSVNFAVFIHCSRALTEKAQLVYPDVVEKQLEDLSIKGPSSPISNTNKGNKDHTIHDSEVSLQSLSDTDNKSTHRKHNRSGDSPLPPPVPIPVC